jgi:uroporphyrinogen-III decarboxylase
MGVRRVEIYVHRSSTDFISPETFKELSFPSLKRLAMALVAAGIYPILHLDGNWDLNLETLRELPAGSCMVQFDGPTDIFLAKRVIGDRICIMGDVPPDMLCLGSVSEVDEYCHRLIEGVGEGGGYIMGAGCEIPPNARPENVKAMIDSVKKYKP